MGFGSSTVDWSHQLRQEDPPAGVDHLSILMHLNDKELHAMANL
jgi:hypothetical protein